MNTKQPTIELNKEAMMNLALRREFNDELKDLDKEIKAAEKELLQAEIKLRKLHLKQQSVYKLLESLQ